MGAGRTRDVEWASLATDCLCCTEMDLPLYSTQDVREAFTAAKQEVIFGQACNISKADDRLRGRRVCASTQQKVKLTRTDDNATGPCADLLQSGRWAEFKIPIGSQGHTICVAVFYGIAGASARGKAYDANELLLAAVIDRLVLAD